uniref:Uncharacterized protein n=1 Tax=Arundo donax TaxID=35708 RepID=A0A0A8ZCQ5_ARUDO
MYVLGLLTCAFPIASSATHARDAAATTIILFSLLSLSLNDNP